MATQLVATRYELRERIGAGGVAVVYRAFDRRLERDVALKVLRSEYAADEEFLTRFEREARIAAGLNHPNIVRVDDYGQYDDTFFIAMEYVDGPNLKEYVRVRGRLAPDEAVRIARDLLSALSAAHRQGLVHRDVTPQNVLLGKDVVAGSEGRSPKLTDFGIARMPAMTQLTQLGTTMGTAAYVAPEQASGTTVGPAADLYGVGLLLYEMLTGRPPFEGETPAAVIYRHVHEPPRPPSQLRPDLPRALEAVVMRALEKDPAARFASAEEMSEALRAAVVAQDGPTLGSPPVVPATANTIRLPEVTRAPPPTASPPAAAPLTTTPPGRRAVPLWPLVLLGALIALGGLLFLLRSADRGAGVAATPGVTAGAPAARPSPPTPTVVPPPAAVPRLTPITPPAQAPPAKAAPPAGTLVLEDTAFQGGFRNPGGSIYRQRSATWIYGARTPYSTMAASFELPAAPSGQAVLTITGLDSENAPKTPISITINDREIFRGPAPFADDSHDPDFRNASAPWSDRSWPIPPDALRVGTNRLTIRNLADTAGVGVPPFFMLDRASVAFP